MKKAFTLIELLVVIAIIAILAAILFPVFAQAKEAAKKTQGLTNVKQSGTAIMLYMADYEDTFPSAYPVSANAAATGIAAGTALTMQWGWAATMPEGADDPIYASTDGQMWANSTNPYRKNYDITVWPGKEIRDVYVASYMATFTKAPANGGMSMNGLLSTLGQGGVVNSSTVPLLWPGHYPYNFRGGIQFHGSPSLNCPAEGVPCQFNAGGPAQSGATGNGDQLYTWTALKNTLWLYGRGFVYVRADTSAKFTTAGSGRSYASPFALDTNGIISGNNRCSSASGGTAYSSWFRPDTDQRSYPLAASGVCGF